MKPVSVLAETCDSVLLLSLGPSLPEPRLYFKLGQRSLVLIMCLPELAATFKLKGLWDLSKPILVS